jgi:hypothetical protein
LGAPVEPCVYDPDEMLPNMCGLDRLWAAMHLFNPLAVGIPGTAIPALLSVRFLNQARPRGRLEITWTKVDGAAEA